MKRTLLIFIMMLLAGLATGQESIYSLSTGPFFMHGDVTTVGTYDEPESIKTLDALFLPVRATYFTGSREWGGLVFSYETQVVSYDLSLSGTPGGIDFFYHRKVSMGYEFYGRLTKELLYRVGPSLSATASQGTYRRSTYESGSFIQFQPFFGANGEFEFFPFDTDSGMVNGLHLLAGLTIEVGLPNISTVLLSPRVGVGYIL